MPKEVSESKEDDINKPTGPNGNKGIPLEEEIKNNTTLFIGFIIISGIIFILSLALYIIYSELSLLICMIIFLILMLIDIGWYTHYRVWLSKELDSLADFLNSLDLDNIDSSDEVDNKDINSDDSGDTTIEE